MRRNPAHWVADDLKKMNRPSTIVRTLRRHPMVLVHGFLYGLAAAAMLAVGLLAFGNLDAFADYAPFAGLLAALRVGSLVHAHSGPLADRDAEREERLEAVRSLARRNVAEFYEELEKPPPGERKIDSAD